MLNWFQKKWPAGPKAARQELLAGACFLAALLLFIALTSAWLLPVRDDHGSNWGAFLQEEKNSLDAMFFGSSIVYCDVIPAIIYETSGYASYVMAGPEQTLPMTYYYIKEMYRSQKPQLVLVEVSGAFFPRYTNYTKINIGYMPWSANRLAATFATAGREEWTGLLFPLYNYHELWVETSLRGKRYSADRLAGYSFLGEGPGVKAWAERKVEWDEKEFERNVSYLQKITRLCGEKGSEVIFFVAPSYWPWENSYLNLLEARITALGADYADFNKSFAELGIDDTADFYDLLHFNAAGAKKFSAYVGAVIQGRLSGASAASRALWDERLAYFRELPENTE